jgi:hypothetical protein
LLAVITRHKYSEALEGISCLLMGGGLIRVKLTFPLAELLPCMPYSPYEDALPTDLYERHRFPAAIIGHCVRLY